MSRPRTLSSSVVFAVTIIIGMRFVLSSLRIALSSASPSSPGSIISSSISLGSSAASAARKKLGFPVPVRDWLRQEPYTSRVRAVFSRPAAAEFFDPRALHSMLNQHLHGGDCWRQIWCVYSFLIWYEQFFGA